MYNIPRARQSKFSAGTYRRVVAIQQGHKIQKSTKRMLGTCYIKGGKDTLHILVGLGHFRTSISEYGGHYHLICIVSESTSNNSTCKLRASSFLLTYSFLGIFISLTIGQQHWCLLFPLFVPTCVHVHCSA